MNSSAVKSRTGKRSNDTSTGRTRLQSAFKLFILRVRPPECDYYKNATGVIGFQRPRDPASGRGKKIDVALSPEDVPGSVNEQGLTVLLKHLLLENGDGGGVASTIIPCSGITPEDANFRIGSQFRIDFSDGREKVRINW